MTMQSRLQRVTQHISPLQRATLVLQAKKEGREPDPDLRQIDDEVQRRAFNRYMALLWVANHYLGAIASIISYRVELAEQAAQDHELFNEVAGLVEEREGLAPSKPSRNWRSKDLVTVPEFLRGVALERRDKAAETVEHLWQETLALETVCAELAEEFGGEDILLPEFRQRDAETKQRLKDSARKVGLRKLPAEPGEEYLQVYHHAVQESFEQLGYAGGQ
jgi:hypothetical protein